MSVLLPSRPLNAVAAAAVALIVVGAGGAIGIGTSGSNKHGHTATSSSPSPSGSGNTPAARPGARPPAPTTTVPSQTSTSIGSVPVVGQGSSSTTAANRGAATTTTTPASSGSPAPGNEPATGTYHYATQGSSTVFGQTYPLPKSTTIDVARSGCGESERWNEAPGDSITTLGCPVKGGVHVISQTSQTTVNGHTMTQTFTCDSDSFVPLSGTPGQTWKWACHSSNGETSEQTVTLVGPDSVTVAGQNVSTEHVSIRSVLTGSITGTSDADDWFDKVGLPIKENGNINASEYGVTFKSNYAIQITGLEPS